MNTPDNRTHASFLQAFRWEFLLLAAVGTALAAWTWGTWPDVLIDFGRELYIAWRLASGERLYADIAYYNGPLSPYLNAVWFTLFGVSLRTLVICNLTILGVLVALVFHLARKLADRFTATAVCLLFLCIFAFNQYVDCGNYNYVCPYSHDAVHGLILSLASFICLWKAAQTGRTSLLALGGLTWGLVFLTRSEVFTAATLGLLPFFLFVVHHAAFRTRRTASITMFLLAALLPVVLSIALLSIGMPLKEAVLGTLGAWPALFSGKLTGMSFFKLSMGTDQFAANLVALLNWTGWTLVVVAMLWLPARLTRRVPNAVWIAVSLGVVVMAPALLTCRNAWIFKVTRSLPLWTMLILFLAARRAWQERHSLDTSVNAWAVLGLSLFSLGMLVKILLFARVFHYGFLHAMPAFILTVAFLLFVIPRRLDAHGRSGIVFRCGATALLAALAIGHLASSHGMTSRKTMRVASGADAFWADEVRGQAVNLVVERLHEHARPGHTLVVMPEGVMINYLARLKNPTPHTNFMPTEMEIFGEPAITESVITHPPDWIALAHKDTSEFGVRFFGTDYARDLGRWVSQHYHITDRIGEMPLVDDRYGILLLRRSGAE